MRRGCISVLVVFVIAVAMVTGAMAWGFGTYSKAYIDRQDAKRWAELCKGGGRYQAMAEAFEKGKPNPCEKKK